MCEDLLSAYALLFYLPFLCITLKLKLASSWYHLVNIRSRPAVLLCSSDNFSCTCYTSFPSIPGIFLFLSETGIVLRQYSPGSSQWLGWTELLLRSLEKLVSLPRWMLSSTQWNPVLFLHSIQISQFSWYCLACWSTQRTGEWRLENILQIPGR